LRRLGRPSRLAPRTRRAAHRRHGPGLLVEALEDRLTPSSTDVAVTMHGDAVAPPGGNVSYSITVTNNGPGDAQSVTLADALPDGTAFVSAAETAGPAFTCTTPSSGGTGTVSCSIDTLSAGQSATFQVVLQVLSGTPLGTVLTNTAAVTTTTRDTNPANDTSAVATTVNFLADLAVTETGPTGIQPAASLVTWTISVANNGPDDAQSVSLTDAVPDGASFGGVLQTMGPSFTCTPPGPGNTPLLCTIDTLAAGESATFEVLLQAGPNTVSVRNTGTVASGTADPNPANNSKAFRVLFAVQVQLTLSPNTVADGSPPGSPVGVVSIRNRLEGQFRPPQFSLPPGEADNALFALDPGTGLFTQFRACYATRASYVVIVHVNIGVGDQAVSLLVGVNASAIDHCQGSALDSVQVVRGGRQGRAQALVLVFSTTLDPGSATGLGHYAVRLGFRGRGRRRRPITAPLLAAAYDPARRAVTLFLGKIKGTQLRGTLTVEGLLDLGGDPLDVAPVFVDLRPRRPR
jgi:uncharacterized repeat protein (TIGR01451 family)